MKKKILITSLILVIVPTILFSILYGIMVNVIYNSGEDYSQEVIGEWAGVQYLKNKQLTACNDDECITLTFDKDYIYVDGTILEPGNYSYKWDTGSIARVKYKNEDTIFVISINSIGQMKVTINSMDYIITLSKADIKNDSMD